VRHILTTGQIPTAGRREQASGGRQIGAAFAAAGAASEQAVFWLFVAGLAWVPFWYGSNVLLAWGINALLFPGLLVAYEISLLARGQPHPVGIRHLAVPAALFAAVILWIGFQSLAGVRAPVANPIWEIAAKTLGRPLDGSVSVDRDLTVMAFLRLITAASVFWLAAQLARDGLRAIRILGSIAAIGCGYAAYGLIAWKTGPLPWLHIPSGGDFVSSTFINRDDYATFAGMGVVATAGLLLQFYGREAAAAAGNRRLQAAFVIEATGRRGAALLVCGFLIMAALLLTASRGGVTATLLGLFVVGVLVRRGDAGAAKQPIWILAAGFLLVAAIMLVFGGTYAGKLEEQGVYDASRMAVYDLTVRSIRDAPLLGWGYGTFRDVFPMYRDHSLSVDGIWLQAHDTYLEVFQGLGLVFGAMLVASVLSLVLRTVRGAMRRRKNAIVPCVAAGTAALVGAHALVDFSLQMQAVALTFMALLGAGVAQSASSRVALAD
jgi:O-antigen ligase